MTDKSKSLFIFLTFELTSIIALLTMSIVYEEFSVVFYFGCGMVFTITLIITHCVLEMLIKKKEVLDAAE